MKKNYYFILEVDSNATQNEIKKAYRKLSLKYHPDRNSGNKEAEEKFKEVNEANAHLSNKDKRLEHDYDLGIKQRPKPAPLNNGFDWSSFAKVAVVVVFIIGAIGLIASASKKS